jgi:hypothetical protein
MDNVMKAIERLADKAASAEKSEDAMRFSQAALNAANVALSLSNLKAAGQK